MNRLFIFGFKLSTERSWFILKHVTVKCLIVIDCHVLAVVAIVDFSIFVLPIRTVTVLPTAIFQKKEATHIARSRPCARELLEKK